MGLWAFSLDKKKGEINMTNTIDINVNNTASSCHIDLYNKELDKNISFMISKISLYDNYVQKEDLINAYSVDNTAIVEATTYTNSLLLTVDEDDMELVSEDTNRMAIYLNNMPFAQITTLSITDEEGNHLHSSLQQREGGVEVVIEEESAVATNIVIQFTPYVFFDSSYIVYLRSFGEIDYWYDVLSRQIYTVDKYGNKNDYIKLSSLHVSTGTYLYQVPAMISETVFFSNYKKCFFKINGSSIDKIKDETSFISMNYLYNNVWLTANKETNAYTYNIIEFTDIETATYEVKDTYTLNVGKSVSEYYYMPYVHFNYGDQLRVNFYSYQFNSYLPTTADQYLCAHINKETKTFDFTDIEPNNMLIYKNDEYKIVFKWSDRKYYVNDKAITTSYTYPTKPLTLIEDGFYYGVVVGSLSQSTADLVKLNLNTLSMPIKTAFIDKLYSNGAYCGKKSVDTSQVIDEWDVFKDIDIDKRHIRSTEFNDFIIPEGVYVNSTIYATITSEDSIFLKREAIQNKKFLISHYPSACQLCQRNNPISASITVSENTNIEIKAYSSFNFRFADHFILTEDKDFNIFTSITDVVRQAENDSYELAINDVDTIFEKTEDNKYDLSFKKWEDYTETFEDYPNTLIKWTNSTYNEHGLLKSDIRAKDGTYSGYMGREEKGGSSVPDYYSEFITIGDKITFDYYNSFVAYSQRLRVYINNVQMFDEGGNSTAWKTVEVSLKKNMINTVKFLYEDGTVAPANDKGFFIDNLSCKVPVLTNDAEVYLKPVDLSFYDAPQGINIVFNELEASSNVSRQLFYSINGGQEWLEFTGLLPNVDNILLKAVFTKTSDDAYVRFSSIEVIPGEFEYISYTDTSRKVYDTKDIVTKLNDNHSIEVSENNYKLLFKDLEQVILDFEGDKNSNLYELIDDKYRNGTVELVNEEAYSGERCCKYTWLYGGSEGAIDRVPTIAFNANTDKLSFKAKVTSNNGGNIYIYQDGSFKKSISITSEYEYQDFEVELDSFKESLLSIGFSGNNNRGILYIDDITYSAFLPKLYSYVESEVLDLSLYPEAIKCDIKTINLQSTHSLDITNFYSVDNGEWQPFEGTLPNVNNVRIKTVFTKASIEEVVEASFESIVITQETGQIVAILSDLDRQVVVNNTISSDTCRQTSKNYISIIDTNRKVLKDMFNLSDTLRRMYITDVQVNASTIREVVNSASSINDLRRIVDKAIIAKATTKRMVIKNINSLGSTKRIVAVRHIAYADTKRKVENLYDIIKYFDTLRNVMRTIDVEILFDTLRVIYEEESPFEAQLSIELIYDNGMLRIGDQEYK